LTYIKRTTGSLRRLLEAFERRALSGDALNFLRPEKKGRLGGRPRLGKKHAAGTATPFHQIARGG
jgi:hypothetical protein